MVRSANRLPGDPTHPVALFMSVLEHSLLEAREARHFSGHLFLAISFVVSRALITLTTLLCSVPTCPPTYYITYIHDELSHHHVYSGLFKTHVAVS
jgi:hypothetical protein